jgi:molybdopterin synthase sulfur carrier subunit
MAAARFVFSPRSCQPDALSREYNMTITALFFASYADAFGRDRLEMEVPSGSTVGDLLRQLQALDQERRLPPSPLVAVNERYARHDHVLRAGDEVAVIPPVAGG